MAGFSKQIIGSFENIGADILKQTAQVPKDIVGKALESLGTATSKSQNNQSVAQPQISSENAGPKDHWDKIDNVDNRDVKRIVARAALEALTKRNKTSEPSVWEKLQKEDLDKKEMEKQQAAIAAKNELPKMSAKRKRGDLYGMQAKKNSGEIGKNVKTD